MAYKKQTRNRKIVLASGVFDVLHLGHIRFLEEAKKAGGSNAELIVIVARDIVVEKRKGKRPVMPEEQRCALVASLRIVDEAMLGYEFFDVGKVIGKIRPAIIAFGYDQDGMQETVKNYIIQQKLNIKTVRIGKFQQSDLDSSLKIKQRIIEDFKR
jgi:FAD synthetase